MNLMTLGAKIKALAVLLVLATVVSMSEVSASPATADCIVDKAVKKIVVNDDGTRTITWEVKCSGGCSSGDCKPRTATDATGEFTFCGCGTGKKHWPGKCCSLVLRAETEGGTPVPVTWGNCTSCTTPVGVCAIIAHPNEANTKVGFCAI